MDKQQILDLRHTIGKTVSGIRTLSKKTGNGYYGEDETELLIQCYTDGTYIVLEADTSSPYEGRRDLYISTVDVPVKDLEKSTSIFYDSSIWKDEGINVIEQ